MDHMPIIRFEIESMQYALCSAIHEHAMKTDEMMQAAVAEFCKPEHIGTVIREKANTVMKNVLEEEIRKFFTFGEGRAVIADAVREKLLPTVEDRK